MTKSGFKLQKLMNARCLRLLFRKEAQRWVADAGDPEGHGVRFDGATLPPVDLVDMNRDEMGGTVLADKRTSKSIRANPVQQEALEKGTRQRAAVTESRTKKVKTNAVLRQIL